MKTAQAKKNVLKPGFLDNAYIIVMHFKMMRNGCYDYTTLSKTRKHCIKSYLEKLQYAKDPAKRTWEYWQERGVSCVKVNVSFNPL